MRPHLNCSRRHILRSIGITGIAAVSGCLTSDSQAGPCSEDTDLSLVAATSAHVSNEFSAPVNGLAYAANTVVQEALEKGEATSRGYYPPEIPTEYVVTTPDVHYYRVASSEKNPTEAPGYEYSVDIGITHSAVPDDEVVHLFTELPAQDRESIHRALGRTVLLHAPHYTSFSVVFAYEDTETRETSAFVPETDVQYVEWEDTLLRLKFTGKRQVQITSTTVTTESVAESPEQFVEHVGGERGTVLGDITDQQRNIVDQAIEDEYSECKPYSESFSDFLDYLSTDDGNTVPLVQYETVWYFVHLS